MKNSSKPTYPIHPNADFGHIERHGLTKREHFAAMAMQSIISNNEYLKLLSGIKTKPLADLVADDALNFADRLLNKLEIS